LIGLWCLTISSENIARKFLNTTVISPLNFHFAAPAAATDVAAMKKRREHAVLCAD